MLRVTISIIAPNSDLDSEFVSLEVAPDLSVADLKGFVNAETNIPVDTQQLYLGDVHLTNDAQSLAQAGIKDGDLLALLVQKSGPQSQTGTRRPDQSTRRGQPNDAGAHEIETTRLNILGNAQAMAQIREQRPALAEAMHDSTRFRQAWMEMLRDDQRREDERMEQLRLLNDDPFNVEAQRKIEEMIRQQSVQENLQFAYEHNPEVFGRVTMLYIPVIVNKHPVKAFVDSGAQTTIMSPACAEACGIMRLIDKRYSGVARGVGTAQILGRVHSADIRIGNANMSCSFTVMEGKDVDLLLGLDMLKRFQALIDLRQNKLIFGDGNEVAFLGEAEIPKSFEESEPAVPGPNGTEIGAQTGTVKPAGTSAAASAAASAASGSGSSSSAFQGAGRSLGSSTTAPTSSAVPAQQPEPRIAATPGAAAVRQTSAHPEASISQLVSLGFDRQQAIAALDATGGNIEYAAGLLFQG